MTGVVPYTDQIWYKSRCREYEQETNRLLRAHSKNKNIRYQLVDQIDLKNYKDYQLITDNVLTIDRCYQSLWPEYWGTFSYEPEYNNQLPGKLFNCFINRTCPIRQSWFYQLVRRNLIDQGHVSFMLDYRKQLAPEFIDLDDKLAVYNWIFAQGCEIFSKEHNLMTNLVPYRNFDMSIDNAIIDSKISVVLETYFDNNQAIAFSEKIFRILQMPRPFLLFCSMGAVKILREQGFNVYDDVVNHSYDLEPDSLQRQICILDEIEKQQDLVYTQDMLENFENRAKHNRQLLKELKNQWPSKLKKVIDTIDNTK